MNTPAFISRRSALVLPFFGVSSFRAAPSGLDTPAKKELALQLVSSAENSSLDWRAQYPYIEDIHDGRGYTAGIIGFCSGTGDMLKLVELYTRRRPRNALARYLPALRSVSGGASHRGLDPFFVRDWRVAARDAVFRRAQEDERDRVCFAPALRQGRADGLRALGQFAYFDAYVMHGESGFAGIREQATARARTPARGGDERTYLTAFLDARVRAMRREPAHRDTSRVDTAQRLFLRAGNLDLVPPLEWKVYGDHYRVGRG